MSGIVGNVGSKSGVIGTTELEYEEGTWTPTCAVGSLADASFSRYVKFGNQIWLSASCTFDGSGGGTHQTITIPFTTGSVRYNPGYVGYTSYTSGPLTCIAFQNATVVYFYKQSNATAIDAAAFANKRVDFTVHIII